ncbi:hypothetical protein P692DRAFT_20100501 [Suillus brevipes Sb2]|nr:hypothetical protein P692DRAFT_20100501 [Suillus brevipes Sb2]
MLQITATFSASIYSSTILPSVSLAGASSSQQTSRVSILQPVVKSRIAMYKRHGTILIGNANSAAADSESVPSGVL